MTEPYRIFVVLDRDYGQRLKVLAPAGPVWVVDTPANRSAAEKSWAENRLGSHLGGVTTFKFGEKNSPEEILISELDTIERHHGEYWANPPYTVLEVIGTPATARLKRELSRFGFNQFQDTAEGFYAIRPLATEVAAS